MILVSFSVKGRFNSEYKSFNKNVGSFGRDVLCIAINVSRSISLRASLSIAKCISTQRGRESSGCIISVRKTYVDFCDMLRKMLLISITNNWESFLASR